MTRDVVSLATDARLRRLNDAPLPREDRARDDNALISRGSLIGLTLHLSRDRLGEALAGPTPAPAPRVGQGW